MPSMPFRKKNNKENPNPGKPTPPTSPSVTGPYTPPGFDWIVQNGGFALVRTGANQGREAVGNHASSSSCSGSGRDIESHGVKDPRPENGEDPMKILDDAHDRFRERLSIGEAETQRLQKERNRLQQEVDRLNETINELREENNSLKLSLKEKRQENEAILDASRRATASFLEEMQRIQGGGLSPAGPSKRMVRE